MTHALATVVLVASLLVVLAYWYTAQERGLRQAEAMFRAESDQVVELMRQRLVNYELLVRGGASLQASLPQPSRAQWQRYVGGLRIEDRFPAVQALGFALDAQPQELGALEQLLPGIARGAMPAPATRTASCSTSPPTPRPTSRRPAPTWRWNPGAGRRCASQRTRANCG